MLLRRFPQFTPASWTKVIPSASPEAIDLIAKLTAWDPARRLSSEQALRHPYFAVCMQAWDLYEKGGGGGCCASCTTPEPGAPTCMSRHSAPLLSGVCAGMGRLRRGELCVLHNTANSCATPAASTRSSPSLRCTRCSCSDSIVWPQVKATVLHQDTLQSRLLRWLPVLLPV
jgi:hypothetical protein